jgi:tetratricopeptide (TPR) repeat protein
LLFNQTIADEDVGAPATCFSEIIHARTNSQNSIMHNQRPLSADQAVELAAQFQSQGRLQEAEQLLRQVLQNQPNHAFALHLLGIIAHQAGQREQAVELIRQAIRHKGKIGLFHANLGEISRQLGRLDDAIAHGKRAVTLEPQMAMAHGNLGIAYFDRKDYALAETCMKRALALQPNFAPALNYMGNLMRAQKRYDEAIVWYNKAIATHPNYLEPMNNLGALLLELARPEEAAAALERALQLNPNYAEALCNRGGVHLVQEQYEAALDCYRRALQLRPDFAAAQWGLGKTWFALENQTEAEAAARQTLRLDPSHAGAHALLGNIHVQQEQPEQAEAEFEQALQLDPECNDALLGLGGLCLEQGKMKQAEELLARSLASKPDNLEAHIAIVQARKVKPGDESFTALQAEAQKSGGVFTQKTMALHFSLGKGYDDLKEHGLAFPHFLAACKLKRATLNYDPADTTRRFDELMDIFDRDTIKRLGGSGDPSQTPLFVLGMPRSGTTLTEQIIASHPDVYGAGELQDLSLFTQNNLRALDHDTLAAWGADYATGLQRRAPDARRITDKMPANFQLVGLIHLMLPNAKIIHVNRNPVDTCVSCFTKPFTHGQEFSYDLTELGRYYADYARLMQHWREVLPQGAFLDVRYEDIVADKEAQARRLIEYCGLEWNDACLDFHKTERAVRTASVTQVRQPIYTSSVERWRAYEQFLEPLLDALGELVPGR